MLATLLMAGAARIATAATAAPTPEEQGATTQPSRWEFLVASGTLIPTGAQRANIRRADTTSAQLTYVARPHIAVTTAVGWARSRDVASEERARVNIFSYDLGAEFRPLPWNDDRSLAIKPFAGLGAGLRSYDYHDASTNTQHEIAGYISAGGEVGIRRLRIRLEVRDYLTGFTSVHTDSSRDARSEVVAMLGLRIIKRSTH
jgi:hypothetical protein